MNNITDIVIIGAGPAGLSAAINAVTRGKTIRIFSNNDNYLSKAERVDNHLGFYNISGKDMMNQFIEHAENMNVNIENKKAVNILPLGESFLVNINGEIIESKKVILAMGISKVKEIAGESNLLGMGVSYCATCDGMLYRNKKAIVWDLSHDALKEANYLKDIGVNVTFVSNKNPSDELNPEIKYIKGTIKEIKGNNKVESILVDDKEIEAEAVFILREAVAPTALIDGLETENGFITVNRNMQTNIDGLYAAGDCTGKPLQISKAVSEGLIAAQHAAKEIDN
ncbi:MAG: FAD-dependent oxidoreductase [Tissierellia bacterium]|nr:FAD-dependent oxidoreductase [Tissierellia bacterium]